MEYSAADETVNLEIKYTEKNFNPLESDNALSLKLLEGVTEGIEHSECSYEEYTNVVKVDIKEK